MTEPIINMSQLVDSYEQTLGIEGARRLITSVLVKAGLSHKEAFNAEEINVICGLLMMEKGFIGTTANILLARLRLKSWNKKTEMIRQNLKIRFNQQP